ncbi:hypothetical protein K505DRAFT_265415 [Melanomma pulvis-pyrius CBS 109.77]|uniref:TPR-like protein n=1 Tax=Melanomma pulvis-pyrius CBS 109.77 TaxID=1314802 RepID=A0A6A6XUB2_9PLEO|nr:hypothetical protein K505DRAFT_265415 [Melanomma pulvis-pyrius CBS 109.77]
MYEPVASRLGTANLLNCLDGVLSLIEQFNKVPTPDPKGIELLEQVKDLVAVTTSLDDLATSERRNCSARLKSLSAADLVHLNRICSSTAELTQECPDFLDPLKSSLEVLLHERDTDAASFTSSEDLLGEQAWYDETYKALKLRTEVLQVLLAAINVLQYKNDTDDDGNLSAEARSFSTTLPYRIALVNPKLHNAPAHSITSLQNAISAATAIRLHVPAASLNKHFDVGRSVKSFYTGRETEMATLKAAFDDSTYSGQKRFVIYGLGGSGKTELALKYAEDSQHDYWGVFFVDGSSRKSATGSYSEIAKTGGVEPNEKAAKNWLATRDLPWLLIIDNVDDDKVRLEELLPPGTKGCILVTSRNPAHISYGTVGDMALELLPMDKDEANVLILRAANEPSPWTQSLSDSASVICRALGFLPLALVHAGKAIMSGLCAWGEYLTFYDKQTRLIRRARRDKSRSRSAKRFQEDEDGMNVFSSYEIIYQSLEVSQEQRFQDAVELLHVFSYFHFQNIRLDILIRAATNPLKEAREMKKQSEADEEVQKRISKSKSKSWSSWFRELAVRGVRYLDTSPPLPSALKNPSGISEKHFEEEVDVRLRRALVVLVARSLVMKQDRISGRYSMHPLVHKWIRDRPEMSTAQQALWCQVAKTTLAGSILIPPLGDTDEERSMRRELLPHIMHARERHEMIEKTLQDNRTARKGIWPVAVMGFGRLEANEAARFSRVYSECGIFEEAERLQSRVRKFVIRLLGEEHPLSIKLTLLLAGTLYELTRVSEATQLQRRIFNVCMEFLSYDDPLTLMVMDKLGAALCFIGRWAESLSLHENAVNGMRKIYGAGHENTLKAICNMGRVHYRYLNYEEASKLHREAWDGMKKRLGETHFETLICLEELAVSQIRMGKEYLEECHEMMKFVLDRRRENLGKEQPYTLLAICNLGRVKSAMGRHEEAARIMKEAVAIAERNLGESHFGVLAGKTHYAQVLVNLGQHEDAERIFKVVINKPQYRKSTDEDGEHPDRVVAMWYLIGCLGKQGKSEQALRVCDKMVVSLGNIGGQGRGKTHKLASMLEQEIAILRAKIRTGASVEDEDHQWVTW